MKLIGYVLVSDLKLLEAGHSMDIRVYPVPQRDDAGMGELYPQAAIYADKEMKD